MSITIKHSDIDGLVDILAKQAGRHFDGPRMFLLDLVDRAHLPERWTLKLAGVWKGDPYIDALRLVRWGIAKGINPEDRRFTTLGAILRALLPDLGAAEASTVVAIIFVYDLYRDKNLLDNLRMGYQVPQAASMINEEIYDIGPEIDWQGPTDQVQLQSWLRPEPDFQDVGFLMRAIERATSVCRIEIPKKKPQGTGFLIAPTLLLTNYHVLKSRPDDDIQKRARDAVLRFGNITAEHGEEAEGQEFKLVTDKPVLKASLADKLDYVLLQVEDSIKQSEGIKPAPLTLELPFKGMALNILQHPGGEALKLALSGDGVDKVFEEKGIVQYSTRARGGSSGSPCFTDEWKVIALHHAERSKSFGTIREGIIFKTIYEEIEQHL